jgi:hypothetical protein
MKAEALRVCQITVGLRLRYKYHLLPLSLFSAHYNTEETEIPENGRMFCHECLPFSKRNCGRFYGVVWRGVSQNHKRYQDMSDAVQNISEAVHGKLWSLKSPKSWCETI